MERVRLNRRVMDKFRIDELSAVDRPAQTHARVTLMKRADDTQVLAKRADGSEHKRSLIAKLFNGQRNKDGAGLERDDDTRKVLNAKTTPLTFLEAEFMSSLEGEQRRAFLLADHDARQLQMAAANDADNHEDDDEMKHAATREEAAAFDTFDAAVKALAKAEGLSPLAAMRAASVRHRDQLEKGRFVPSGRRDHADRAEITKGRTRQAVVNDEIAKVMSSDKTLTNLEALRMVKARSPELFD